MPVPQAILQSNVDSMRYAKVVEVSKRVRFDIGHRILEDMLHGGNPVRDAANVALCERNRERIANDPGHNHSCRCELFCSDSGRI